jgi:plastocyanin
MKRLLTTAMIAVALIAACGNGGDDDGFDDVAATTAPQEATLAPTTPPATASPTVKPTPTEKVKAGGDCQDNSKAEGQADLEMQDFVFAPPCLIMSTTQGLRLHNEGEVTHNFSVKGYEGLNVDVKPGEENNTEPTGLKPGTYDFFCRFHAESQDMKGELRLKKTD